MSKQTLLRMCIPGITPPPTSKGTWKRMLYVEGNLETKVASSTSKGTWKRRLVLPSRREPGNVPPSRREPGSSRPVEGNLETPAPSKGTWKLRPQTGNSGPVEGNLETPPPSKGTWNRRLLSSVNVHPSRVRMNKKQTTADPREGIASWRLTRSSTARRLNRPVEFLICFR